MGAAPSLPDLKEKYAVDAVRFVDEIAAFLASAAPARLHVYGGENSDSGSKGQPAQVEGAATFEQEGRMLHRALHEARVVKSSAEVEVLQTKPLLLSS